MDLGAVTVGNEDTTTMESELATTTTFDTSATSISTITQPVLSPNTTDSNLASSRINIGQYPTPPMQSLSVNESSYEDGYDSDGEVGPFYDSVFGI